jgi:hypothetical protein
MAMISSSVQPMFARRVAAACRSPCAEQCGRLASSQRSRNQLPNPADENDLPRSVTRNDARFESGCAFIAFNKSGCSGIINDVSVFSCFTAIMSPSTCFARGEAGRSPGGAAHGDLAIAVPAFPGDHRTMDRPQKITFADMRGMGARGLLIYCSDYKCSHLVTMSGNRWPDDFRLSDIEPRFVCSACGKRGADVRPG